MSSTAAVTIPSHCSTERHTQLWLTTLTLIAVVVALLLLLLLRLLLRLLGILDVSSVSLATEPAP